jgi:sRNA-binding carbon storage regulator CsrA
MLEIHRYRNQGIRIGDEVHVVLLGFKRDRTGAWYARIGIDAPRKKVLREELWNEAQLEVAAQLEEETGEGQ